jgi:LmbE family N-acetylglucosaminyl deacetylase
VVVVAATTVVRTKKVTQDQLLCVQGSRSYSMTPMSDANRTALALMAHPDDAEILCAGTMVRLRTIGWEIHIITMTAGDCGTTTMSAAEISTIRREEASRGAEVIGGSYHCMDELDGQVVYDKETIRRVVALFRMFSPSLVFTHALSDYMMDHEITARLARNATQIFGAPNASSVPLRHPSGIPHLYYCDPVEGLDPFGQSPTPTTLIDIRAVLDRKAEALACHASQREWLRAHQGMDEYIDAMKRHAAMRGKLMGSPASEAFVQHRSHGYPRNDLLADCL